MSVEPSIRSRFGGSKVRSGCFTCKSVFQSFSSPLPEDDLLIELDPNRARHVKCDEKKPHCDRCTRASRKCEGYAQPNQNKKTLGGTLIIINYVAPSNMPCLLPTADAGERRSLEYFRTRTAPELAASFNSELWSRFILQTAQHEPAIRHAITALGSLHEHFESAEDAHAANSDFGLQQYGKAMQCVVKGPAPFAGQSTDVALISCILFTAFESLQGHYRSALTHINSGLKVLAEREASGDGHRGSYIPKELLKSLFTRFDTQALEIGDLAFRPWLKIEPDIKLEIPSAFSTLEEAERVFDQYFNTLMHFLQSAEVTDKDGLPVADHILHNLTVRHSNRVKEYQDWCNAFDNYLLLHLTDSNSPDSFLRGKPHPGVLILQIWRTVVRIMLHIDLSAGELVFDSFIDDSRTLVELAESFVKQTAAPSQNPKVLNGVSLIKMERQTANVHPTRLATHPRSWLGSCASHGFLGIQPEGTPCVPGGAAPSSTKSITSATADSYSSPARTNSTGTSTIGPPPRATPANIAPQPPAVLKPTFSLSLGLITPLYITVTRCRDPAIRRRALHLLYTCNRKEGIWDSRLAARVAQRMVEVEEAGAVPLPGQGSSDGTDAAVVMSADQIPEHARVRELETSFLPDRKGRIRYTKSGGGAYSNPSEYYEELLQW
jgi:hypothetical protein